MHTAQRDQVGDDRVQTLRAWQALPTQRRGRAPVHQGLLRHEPLHRLSTPSGGDDR